MHLQLFRKLLVPGTFCPLQTYNRYLIFKDHWSHDQRKASGSDIVVSVPLLTFVINCSYWGHYN